MARGDLQSRIEAPAQWQTATGRGHGGVAGGRGRGHGRGGFNSNPQQAAPQQQQQQQQQQQWPGQMPGQMHGHNWQRNQEYHHQAKANRAARANTEPQQTSGAHYTNTAMTVAMQPRWPNAPAAFIIPTPEFIEGSSMNQEEYHEDGYEINDHLSDDHENYFDLQEDDQDQYVGCSLDDNLANSHSVDACKTFPFCTNVSRCNYNINPIIPICIPERVNPISYYNTALSTYTMGNQHQYYTCAGRTNNCPCPSCTVTFVRQLRNSRLQRY